MSPCAAWARLGALLIPDRCLAIDRLPWCDVESVARYNQPGVTPQRSATLPPAPTLVR